MIGLQLRVISAKSMTQPSHGARDSRDYPIGVAMETRINGTRRRRPVDVRRLKAEFPDQFGFHPSAGSTAYGVGSDTPASTKARCRRMQESQTPQA